MGAPDERGRRRWLATPFIALGVAMIIVDATIVSVAIPTIIRELDTTATAAEWVNSIYSLVFAALLITLGRVGDMVGTAGCSPWAPCGSFSQASWPRQRPPAAS